MQTLTLRRLGGDPPWYEVPAAAARAVAYTRAASRRSAGVGVLSWPLRVLRRMQDYSSAAQSSARRLLGQRTGLLAGLLVSIGR